jgi:hypothetical protein
MKTLFSYATALVFSLSLATAAFAAPVNNTDPICCGDHPSKGKKTSSKKNCKEKCTKTTGTKGCCGHSGSSTSKK